MAENDGGAAAAAQKAEPPLRPTIAVPTRSCESLFRGGGAYDVSPGPMTLVSSFFAEEPDSNCRSFSQLLAGAMASPAATPSRALVSFPTVEATEKADSGGGGGEGGEVMRQNRAPLSFLVAPSPFFMVPPMLSPAGWLDSSSLLFSPGPGQFGISHQEALAQVTAQASQTQSHIPIQAEYPFSAATAVTMTQPTSSGINMALLQHMSLQTSDTNNTTSESAEDTHCDQRSPPVALTIDKPGDDGYNWRKYGQKHVKGSECPRSYYKCTHPSCPVKKKVEHSLDGHVTEIIYKGQHNHLQPAPNRRGKEGGTFPGMCNEFNRSLDFPANSETVLQGESGNFSRSSDTMAAPSISKRERESGNGTSEQLSGSSDDEVGDAKLVADEGDNTKPVLKRRNTDTRIMESTSSHRPVTEPRIIVQTTSEVDLLDDGFRWRKYGQKVVKGNPHPRSYYKCTSAGCNVRKHVERASTDSKDVITTYEGKHNHDIPAARNSSHNTASAGAVVNSLHPKVHNTIPNNQDIRNNVQQSVSFLQLKEEGPT